MSMLEEVNREAELLLTNEPIVRGMDFLMEKVRSVKSTKDQAALELGQAGLVQLRYELVKEIVNQAHYEKVPLNVLVEVQNVKECLDEVHTLAYRIKSIEAREKKSQTVRVSSKVEHDDVLGRLIKSILYNVKHLGGIRKPTGSRMSPPDDQPRVPRLSLGQDQVRDLPEEPSPRDDRHDARDQAKGKAAEPKKRTSQQALPGDSVSKADAQPRKKSSGKQRAGTPAPAPAPSAGNETDNEDAPEDLSPGEGPAPKHGKPKRAQQPVVPVVQAVAAPARRDMKFTDTAVHYDIHFGRNEFVDLTAGDN